MLAIACAVLAGAFCAPGAAQAAKRASLHPASASGGHVVYRVGFTPQEIQTATLRGKRRSRRLSVSRVRADVGRARLRLRLSSGVRRQVGTRPVLVVHLSRTLRPIPAQRDPVSTHCTRYAAPSGSDSGPGTRTEPFASAQHLADSLGSGDVGCLMNGVYAQPILALRHGGTAAHRTVLRSAPGQRALIRGQVWVAAGADHVTVAHLDNDGTQSTPRPSPVVNGDDSLFYDLDVSSQNGVCFYIGDPQWGTAHHTVLQRNRIHDCGKPGLNKRHGIYLSHGIDTVIEQNWIYNNPDRGIQLYPYSQGAVIRGNVIDGNGEGVDFSGDYGWASSGNVVEGNLITNSRRWHDVESWYPDGNPIGTGNVVRDNCIWGGRFGSVQQPEQGFVARDNAEVDPGYVARRPGDFRIPTAGPCAAAVRRGGGGR
jgi:hypothetical protein